VAVFSGRAAAQFQRSALSESNKTFTSSVKIFYEKGRLYFIICLLAFSIFTEQSVGYDSSVIAKIEAQSAKGFAYPSFSIL
jgi:hypothetical protein